MTRHLWTAIKKYSSLRPVILREIIIRRMANSSDTVGDNKFLYFGYGSNLLRERIHIMNPSAVFKTIAKLEVSSYISVYILVRTKVLHCSQH